MNWWWIIVWVLGTSVCVLAPSAGCSWERTMIRNALACNRGGTTIGPATVLVVAFMYMLPWLMVYGILYRSVILCVVLLVQRVAFIYAAPALKYYLSTDAEPDTYRNNAVSGLGIIIEVTQFWAVMRLGFVFDWFSH